MPHGLKFRSFHSNFAFPASHKTQKTVELKRKHKITIQPSKQLKTNGPRSRSASLNLIGPHNSAPHIKPQPPQPIFSHTPRYSKKTHTRIQFPLKPSSIPKSFSLSLTFFNGRKRQISRRRHRQEEHISEQQSRSPVPRRPYRPFPQNRQVRRTCRRWRSCLPRRRPRVSRRRGQFTVFDSYKFCYVRFFYK